MSSSGMKTTLAYNDNDPTYGLVTTKHTIKAYIPPGEMKKDVWKPKTTLRWHEPYRAKLTL